MPLINVKLIEGVFNEAQKKKMVSDLTDAMVAIEGETMRQVTWVVIEEVKSGNWALGGKPLTTADVKALAGQAKRGLATASAQSEAARPAAATAGPLASVLRHTVGGTPNSRLNARVKAASDS